MFTYPSIGGTIELPYTGGNTDGNTKGKVFDYRTQ